MKTRTEVVPVKLDNDKIIKIQATVLDSEQNIASNILSFDDISDTIEEISKSIMNTIDKVKPKKASVEFGVQVALESGKLTAMLVKGTGSASLKITLEWDNF